MKFSKFCDLLLPGDVDSGMPAFTECNISINNLLTPEEISTLEDLIKAYENLNNKHNTEVSLLIKSLHTANKQLLDKILTLLLKQYFSSEQVLKVLRPDAVKLFPNIRALDDINYDLLSNVADIVPNK